MTKEQIYEQALQKALQESQIPAKHYLTLMELLKKRIAENAKMVEENKQLIESNNKLATKIESAQEKHLAQLAQYDKAIKNMQGASYIKGDPGKDGNHGQDGKTPTEQELLELIKPLIPDPEFIDEDKIVRSVLSKIDKPENGKDAVIDEESFMQKFVKYLKEKKPIDISDIRNWQSAKSTNKINMNDMRWHGAGISTLASIIIPVSGTINDTNVNFTSTSEPSILVINGSAYTPTGGNITWTYSSNAITLSIAIGIGGSIFGLK